MRILLSAYACEPHIGSEPGIGWNWALEFQRQGHDTVVLTRANNRSPIEEFFKLNPDVNAPHFVYFDLPAPFLLLKRIGVLPMQTYYTLWQIFCVRAARDAIRDRDIDVVWHLTFGVTRLPSFLWRLGKPFVFGPAGGGERAPFAMRADYPISGHLRDALRDVSNWLSTVDPMMRATFARAHLIFARTPESARLVPLRHRRKVQVFHEVGMDQMTLVPKSAHTTLRILYAGGFIYLKGITLAVRAFAEFVRLGGVARFTLVGTGPERARASRLAETLGVAHLIDWVGWVDQRELGRIYAGHDVFLFPSLHDSGGTVVVEAMSHGLPVVCFDLGGPGQIVRQDCGFVQPTGGLAAHEAAKRMGAAMHALTLEPGRVARLSAGALRRAKEFTWSARVSGALRGLSTASIGANKPL